MLHVSTVMGLSGIRFTSFYSFICFFLPARLSKRGIMLHTMWLAGWLAGWLDVTRRYCVKKAKPILKLFRLPGSHITLVSSVPCADTQFQG